mmetsp:Transcript_35531/g.69008  ORF Transcript_35531/g.69008 Transcript_35531/m.69008 type:complete len:422 (-) Transcript_35531:88-1353(-)
MGSQDREWLISPSRDKGWLSKMIANEKQVTDSSRRPEPGNSPNTSSRHSRIEGCDTIRENLAFSSMPTSFSAPNAKTSMKKEKEHEVLGDDSMAWDVDDDRKGCNRFAKSCPLCFRLIYQPRVYHEFPLNNMKDWTPEYLVKCFGKERIRTLAFSKSEPSTMKTDSKKGNRKRRILPEHMGAEPSKRPRNNKRYGPTTRSQSRRQNEVARETWRKVTKESTAHKKAKGNQESEISFREFDGSPKLMTLRQFLLAPESRYIRWSLRNPGKGRGAHHSGTIPDAVKADVLPPMHMFIEKGCLVDCVLRFGTNSYRYPRHADWAWNCLIQVRGKKVVYFHAPFPPKFRQKGNDPSKDVACSCERGSNGTKKMQLILNEGDLLFIPPSWSHSVESLEQGLSVSVNYFFKGSQDSLDQLLSDAKKS